MLSLLPLTLACLLSVTSDVLAVPRPAITAGQSISLYRRSPLPLDATKLGTWAQNEREKLMNKYGSPSPQKRSSGTNLITNQNTDSSFFGSLAIGTPPVSFNVILDTGSSDLWLASSDCAAHCDNVATFDSSQSSTFQNLNEPFNITYGSGKTSGALGQDTVQMAGFSVSKQVFAVCDTVSASLLNSPVSGLLGLAWQSIASSGAAPFWQTLADSGAWDAPLMAFQLTRFLNDSSAASLEAGGTFTMGFVDSTLYTGDIDYQNIPADSVSYWILPITNMTVQGNDISLPTGSDAYAAIDTGTTLVGGPPAEIAKIFDSIPGSQQGTGQYTGYYTYLCDTEVSISMSFGGNTWSISSADFKVQQVSNTTCLAAFFALSTGSSAPAWIIGDTFLKNVYSVFRFSPASVGFAQLSAKAIAMNGANGAIPSPTIGSAPVAVSATSTTRDRFSNAAVGASSSITRQLLVVALTVLLSALIL